MEQEIYNNCILSRFSIFFLSNSSFLNIIIGLLLFDTIPKSLSFTIETPPGFHSRAFAVLLLERNYLAVFLVHISPLRCPLYRSVPFTILSCLFMPFLLLHQCSVQWTSLLTAGRSVIWYIRSHSHTIHSPPILCHSLHTKTQMSIKCRKPKDQTRQTNYKETHFKNALLSSAITSTFRITEVILKLVRLLLTSLCQ